MKQSLAWIQVVLAVYLAMQAAAAHAASTAQPTPASAAPELVDPGGLLPDEPTNGVIVGDCDANQVIGYDPCPACAPGCQCGPPGLWWVRNEYVGWWATGGRLPALVVTAPDDLLPTPTTIYGDAKYNTGIRSGDWIQAGTWFDCSHQLGLTGDYFFVARKSSPFNIASDGDPLIARPFIDANDGEPIEHVIAAPDFANGSVNVENYNTLAGAGLALRRNLTTWSCPDSCCKRGPRENCCRVDLVAGFRYYRFKDNVSVAEHSEFLDPETGDPSGEEVNSRDSFQSVNSFYGGELGLIFDRYKGRWLFEGAFKVALGGTNEVITIGGATEDILNGQVVGRTDSGILALPTNSGQHQHGNFSVIPQLSTRLGYRVTRQMTFLVGYTAIYWNQVARAGDQIDTTINPNLIPPPSGGGPERPRFALQLSDIFLQGITIGGELCF
jgi:hypothetical protein